MTTDDVLPNQTIRTRLRVAEVLAFVAVVAALIGALGPAERESTTYSWPPPNLSEASPSRVWYTPLLLTRRFPESIAATLPCSAQAALPGAERPVTVLATARSPERLGGLAVRQEGDQLALGIGDLPLTRVALSGAAGPEGDCAYRLTIADRRWSLTGGPDGAELGGELVTMPVVNGLLSGLDLRAGQPPSIAVETTAHGARPTARQTVAWVVAALCLLLALLLVAVERRPRRPSLPLARVLAHAHPADAAVAVVLLVWWVLSPVFWDDGWSVARQSAFATTGGFSNYYESFGHALPLGYWLDWLQHWLTQNTAAVLVLRLPALACLAAIWVLCRWILSRVADPPESKSSVALWAMAATFVVGAMAWGMTLRPEPVVALLVTGVLVCAIRFRESPTAAPLAVAAVVVALAVSVHPAGIVSLAPVIVVAPSVLRWARAAPASAATIATSTIALVLVLAFVGSDVVQRSTDAQVIDEASTTVVGWRDELARYNLFRTTLPDGYGTPLRRASVTLMLLAVLAFAIRRRRRGEHALDGVAPLALVVTLVLLIATPSKWPWHFGALMGLAAVAFAVETKRLVTEERRSSGSTWRALGVIGAVTLGIAWAWSPQKSWNPLDLRTLEWDRPFQVVPLVAVAIGLPLVVLAGVVAALARRRRQGGGRQLWHVARWTAPVLVVPMIVFTVSLLAADAAATRSWTFTRQTVESVRGNAGCGLADDLLIPDTKSLRGAQPVIATRPQPVPAWVPPAPVSDLPRFALGPTSEGSARTPWFALPRSQQIGLYLAGTAGQFDRLGLEWGRAQGRRVQTLWSAPLVVLALSQADSILGWRLITSGELPPAPASANAVRIVLRSDATPGSAIAVTSPVQYAHEALTRRLDRRGVRALVLPNVRMYFPCADHARLSGGAAEVPSIVLTTSDSVSPVRYPSSSPFGGVLDMYRVEHVSIADSEEHQPELVVFGIDRRIFGGRLAPAVATTGRPKAQS